ncbi:hypothetical protein BH18THE2_BH18THE2_26070 [soil metagenome]
MISTSNRRYKVDSRVSSDAILIQHHEDLTDQIRALQLALAHERGENYRFREEIRALLRRL